MQKIVVFLIQTLSSDVFLQTNYLLTADVDSLPEIEIIPLSGVSKSGGAGNFVRSLTCCIELQQLTPSSNIRGWFFDVDARQGVIYGLHLTPVFRGYVRYGMLGEELFLNGPQSGFAI